ncbi:MAG TPA: DNA repair protein RecN [Gammaproteobacteria bacterium]|nr:DNA repair protein RecN [Gammaproteobacteria bacterium]
MLTHIHIWNFAIVESLDIEFDSGLTVLTGETGAGKSILLDALGLALGDRADTSVIRHGCDKADISVSFSTSETPQASAWLAQHEMQSENECIIRRSISRKGASKAFINGIPSTIQQLRELGEMLVDLHGQHEHQSLLHKDVQRQLLDDYANHRELLNEVAELYTHWQNLSRDFARLSQANTDRDSRLELLRYQVQELDALGLHAGETEKLEQELKRLSNANQLLTTSQTVINNLDENEQNAVSSSLAQCATDIADLTRVDEKLIPIAELLSTSIIQVQETVSELRHYLESLELDPERLRDVEQRITDIHNLSRKHRVDPEALVELLPQLRQEQQDLEQADVKLGDLQQQIETAQNGYRKAAKKLSTSRRKTATALSEKITVAMQGLSLQGGQLKVELIDLNEAQWSGHGAEHIEFLVSANPGTPVKPLNKVASGGELSRISLAIQVITAQAARIPTLVFDEVDVGIGGSVAEIVGLQLRALGQRRQVVCVTHLPQVAALGHHHYQVSKSSDQTTTVTEITPLDTTQRIDEIARMLGGIKITAQTLSHAKEMIESAQS